MPVTGYGIVKRPTRRDRLERLVERTAGVCEDDVAQALEEGPVPRYALLTAEGSYQSIYQTTRDLTVYDSAEELGKAIAEQLDEGWPPVEVIDLETGADVGYRVTVEIDKPLTEEETEQLQLEQEVIDDEGARW